MTILTSDNTFLLALKAMESSPFEFHLTGSRAWKNSTEKSDWDFFAQDSEDIREWLSENGFDVEIHSYSGDPSLVSVFRNNNLTSRHTVIEIQLVVDVEKKKQVQNMLMLLLPRSLGGKEESRSLWARGFQWFKENMWKSSNLL